MKLWIVTLLDEAEAQTWDTHPYNKSQYGYDGICLPLSKNCRDGSDNENYQIAFGG